MFSVRTLDGSVEDVLNPKFRKVDFGSTPVVVLVSTHLRYALNPIPNEDRDDNGIGQFIKANHKLSKEERERVPQNLDHDSIYTPLARQHLSHVEPRLLWRYELPPRSELLSGPFPSAITRCLCHGLSNRPR